MSQCQQSLNHLAIVTELQGLLEFDEVDGRRKDLVGLALCLNETETGNVESCIYTYLELAVQLFLQGFELCINSLVVDCLEQSAALAGGIGRCNGDARLYGEVDSMVAKSCQKFIHDNSCAPIM